MTEVKKQDALFIYYAILVSSALFPSPMKNLFHNLVLKTILAIVNIRSLQFCWLKREVHATSPGSLPLWYSDREKKPNTILLNKVPYKWYNIYSGMYLAKLQSSNSLLHFSMHYYHSILHVFKS